MVWIKNNIVRIAILLFTLMLFSSCGARKKTAREDIDENLVRKIEEMIQKRDSIISSTKKLYTLNENIEIIHREFDTNHSPDSLGNYPIKSETIINVDKKGDVEVKEDTKTGSDTIIENKDDTTINNKKETVVEDNKKESSASKWLFGAIALVVLTAIFVFLKQIGFFSK